MPRGRGQPKAFRGRARLRGARVRHHHQVDKTERGCAGAPREPYPDMAISTTRQPDPHRAPTRPTPGRRAGASGGASRRPTPHLRGDTVGSGVGGAQPRARRGSRRRSRALTEPRAGGRRRRARRRWIPFAPGRSVIIGIKLVLSRRRPGRVADWSLTART